MLDQKEDGGYISHESAFIFLRRGPKFAVVPAEPPSSSINPLLSGTNIHNTFSHKGLQKGFLRV